MALTLSDRKAVRFLPGAIIRTYEVGATVQFGEAVALDANGKVVPAKTNAASTSRAIGVVVAGENFLAGTSYAAGMSVSVCVLGPIAGFTGMDVAKPVWVSAATGGESTQTEPSGAGKWSFAVGYPIATNVLFVAPQTTAAVSQS